MPSALQQTRDQSAGAKCLEHQPDNAEQQQRENQQLKNCLQCFMKDAAKGTQRPVLKTGDGVKHDSSSTGLNALNGVWASNGNCRAIER